MGPGSSWITWSSSKPLNIEIENRDTEEFKIYLREFGINYVYLLDDPNEAVEFLTFKINQVLDKLVPWKTVTIRPKAAPWMNKELRDHIKMRNNLFKDWRFFRLCRNWIQKEMKKAKFLYTSESANVKDTKTK